MQIFNLNCYGILFQIALEVLNKCPLKSHAKKREEIILTIFQV